MAKILITGGSGLIGRKISDILLQREHTPVWLSREEGKYEGIKKYKWDISTGYLDERALDGVEHIIHLAGAGIIDKRWTSSYKKEILESRVRSAETLYNHVVKHKSSIKSLTGGSAIGYYGAITNQHVYKEEDLAHRDFLGQTCAAWEQSYQPFIDAGIRTSIVRTGVALSKHGGAYKTMRLPFKVGLGAGIGSGEQYIPWIHINDVASIFVHTLLTENISGVFNGVATEPATNNYFSKTLAKSLHRPFFLPNVPAFLLKAAMGESACTVTEGVMASNQKIKSSGFNFEFDNLREALDDLASI